MKKSLFLLSLLCTMSSFGEELTMKPTKLALFKNGYGFVTMQGSLNDATQLQIKSLPVPSIGTFWFSAPEAKISKVVSGMFDFTLPSQTTIGNLLTANPNKEVHITYSTGKDTSTTVSGIISPPNMAVEKDVSNTITPIYSPTPNPLPTTIVILNTDAGVQVINLDSIINVSFTSGIKMPTRTEKRPGVELFLEEAAPGKTVTMSCLSNGISWDPSYQIELKPQGKAILRAKATITNKLMDVDNVAIELITGYPSLKDSQIPDPIALTDNNNKLEPYRNDIGYATSWDRDDQYNGMAMRTGTMAMRAEDIDMALSGKPFRPEDAVQTDNLFFYPLENFSAKSGQVVTQNLFQTEIEYQSIYTWKIDDPTTFTNPSPNAPPKATDIWNCIRYKNPLPMPLTTARVEFIEKNRIAGTNVQYYTPVGGETTVQMNRAANFTTKQSSELINQQVVNLPPYNSNFTQNTNKVTLSITNDTDKEATIEIYQQVKGIVKEISDEGTCTTSARLEASYQNASNMIKWVITLKPKDTKELNFTYQSIVR